MDSEEKACAFGVIIGGLLATAFWLIAFGLSDISWKNEAVERGAMRYDSMTGKLEWVDQKGPTE